MIINSWLNIPWNTPRSIDSEFDKFSSNNCSNEIENLIPIKLEDNNNSINNFNVNWLYNTCRDYITSSDSNLGLQLKHLYNEIISLVYSIKHNKISDEQLQGQLFDLVGENGIEFMFNIMQNMNDLISFESKDFFEVIDTITDPSLKSTTISNSKSKEDFRDINSLSVNQRIKREKKEKAEKEKEAFLEKEWLEQYQSYDEGFQTSSNSEQSWLLDVGLSEEYIHQERMLGLNGGATYRDESWRANLVPDGSTAIYEKKGLPTGSERSVFPDYEEIFMPAAKKSVAGPDENIINIDTLESWAQLAFGDTKRLNRIQSKVFDSAYHTSENLLVCAPTGAGKTNIAMLTFLQLVKQHITNGVLNKQGIKAIYIAPMKALCQEVVEKFGERLEPLGMVVKEFTGDMQLTKNEIMESQLLVTTPEKYDVITRKGGDGSLGTMVNLIIIDEIHLLADDRGAVLETIVARTQRYIESSQRYIRIIGLSATLPNYKDVAKFLRVNSKSGLFYFGPEYRPVPLDMSFLGINAKNKGKMVDSMNLRCFDKMVTALERGKQIMIFVHSRKETSKTADAMRDLAAKNGTSNMLENIEHEKYSIFKRGVENSRSDEVRQLFYKGLGIHHAGMLRADRTLTERMFECGIIKVLVCTATLAWGVNLPAHTVIIKGTELYDPEKGGFINLGILDVLQIFGRAGRPQYDHTGHAILITPHKTLGDYVRMMSHQAPIESGFIKSLADHMNAEIVNGTINTINEAVSWLTYTFLFVRMCNNPVAYGMNLEEIYNDPQLDKRRIELIKQAAECLDNSMMIRYDIRSGSLSVTDLGRIASHYYIKHGTVEAFNALLTSNLNNSDALHVLCSSAEFDQLKVRPEELDEIDILKKNAKISIKGPVEETAGKVSALVQGYVEQTRMKSFTLQSDMNYVSQNAGRITRALFEICLKRGWSSMASHYLELCKSIDRRIRIDQCPLRQFVYDQLPAHVITRLEYIEADLNKILDMNTSEVGQLIHNQKLGSKVLSFTRMLPYLEVTTDVQPLTRGILRIILNIRADFDWIDQYHGFSESFWIWIEDGENEYIYHSELFTLNKKLRRENHHLDFTIPIREPLPTQYFIRIISDKWVGCDNLVTVSFQHLILPNQMPPHTNLMDMHPIPRSALNNKKYESIYNFSHFNPIQTHVFHALYHTDNNILIGAPTGSGKTIVGELAILRMLRINPQAKAIYVAPLKALARERLKDWKKKLGEKLGLKVLELTGDVTPDISLLKRAQILIVTPEKWDSISRGWQKRDYVKNVELMIIDEIHLLGVDRGPVLEVIVSRMRFISCQTSKPIRFVGLSTALANPRDLANWLGIGEFGMFNFRPSIRPIPMTIHIKGFPGKHYCPRMATMNKPTYLSIIEHSPTKPALIFVSSRRQTRLTALDLISYCSSNDNPKQFLHMSEEEIDNIASTLRDNSLKTTIVFGVGIHHAGLDDHDRQIVEELYLSAKIQVLVCTSTLAWGVNLPCHLVIVKGTEFFDAKLGKYVDMPVTDVLQMIGRAGRPQFDDTGIACVFVHEPKKHFYRKFLHEPFPVESTLHKQLHEHFNAEITGGSFTHKRDCYEYLTWTYYFRRLLVNPSYYQLENNCATGLEIHLNNLINQVLVDLKDAQCIAYNGSDLVPTILGKITSYYYLNYKTVGLFRTRLHKIANKNISDPNYSYIEELSLLISDAYEFSELPVRHNEDGLNEELSQKLPWKVDPEKYGNSNCKAYLLLQAHFYRIQLPISDYITDTKSVLDQVPRVLNALIDIATNEGYLYIVLNLMKISQMVYQGYDFNIINELKQLPTISEDLIKQYKSNNITNLQELLISNLNNNKIKGLSISNELNKYIRELSLFDVKLNFESINSNNTTQKIINQSLSFYMKANTETILNITITRLAGTVNTFIFSPKYHKQKNASYWLFIGYKINNGGISDLLAMKKIGKIGNILSTSLSFIVPERLQNNELFVYLVCDCISGLDVEESIDILKIK
jgi:activating signal cointegrator complex subunit 3